MDKYNDIKSIPRGVVRGTGENLEKLGEADNFLFDLDDTIAIYDEDFIKRSLYKSVKDHVYTISDEDAGTSSALLHSTMHNGDAQKKILERPDVRACAGEDPKLWRGVGSFCSS